MNDRPISPEAAPLPAPDLPCPLCGVAVFRDSMDRAGQVSCCGNSVCPPLAAAIVGANCQHLAIEISEAAHG